MVRAGEFGLSELGAQTLVIVADAGGPAADLYRSVGFRDTSSRSGCPDQLRPEESVGRASKGPTCTDGPAGLEMYGVFLGHRSPIEVRVHDNCVTVAAYWYVAAADTAAPGGPRVGESGPAAKGDRWIHEEHRNISTGSHGEPAGNGPHPGTAGLGSIRQEWCRQHADHRHVRRATPTPPNYIFPFMSLAFFAVNNSELFQYLIYRPLYWFGEGATPNLNLPLSLAAAPNLFIERRHGHGRGEQRQWSTVRPSPPRTSCSG